MTLQNDLVTVYIPTRNRIRLLQQAIESVLTQDYQNIELIVVDDCSEDETLSYLKGIKDSRLKYVRNVCPMGACISRNEAILLASGKYITGLDDDDHFLPNRISSFIFSWQEFEKKGIAFGFLFDESISQTSAQTFKRINARSDIEIGELLGSNFVGSQVFCRRNDLVTAGCFNATLPAWQDWDMWVRLSRVSGKGINIKRGTYLVNEYHGLARISNKPEFVLRYAMKVFIENNQPINRIQSASIRMVLCSYPQVSITLLDVVAMLPALFSRELFWNKLFRRRLKK